MIIYLDRKSRSGSSRLLKTCGPQ